MTVTWDNGDGDQRILVASEAAPISAFPLDGVSYDASPVFGAGDDLGGSNHVVFSGTSNSVTITGLTPDTTYFFRPFEFNQNAVTGNYPLYLLCNSESASSCAVSVVTPVSLRAVKSTTPGRVTLTWDATGSGQFNLHRTQDKTSIPSLWSDMLTAVGSSPVTNIDDDASGAATYFYQLYAADCAGQSVP